MSGVEKALNDAQQRRLRHLIDEMRNSLHKYVVVTNKLDAASDLRGQRLHEFDAAYNEAVEILASRSDS